MNKISKNIVYTTIKINIQIEKNYEIKINI